MSPKEQKIINIQTMLNMCACYVSDYSVATDDGKVKQLMLEISRDLLRMGKELDEIKKDRE